MPDSPVASEFPGLRDARPPLAAGPAPTVDGLRRAYLDLLALSLCDLTGTSTVSVGKWDGGTLSSRELRGADLRWRAAGMDWPLTGLTMVGLGRLADLEACVTEVVDDGVPGDLIEVGTWRGGAAILMRATLDALGEDGRTVVLADSFQGFPAADGQGDLNATEFLAVPLEEVRASFARFGLRDGVEFVPGFFEATLGGLADRTWSVLRLDGDTYEATWHALATLYPGVAAGGHVIVDDYRAMPECGRAVDAFRLEHGIREPLHGVDWTCVRWRREAVAGPPPARPAAPVDPSRLRTLARSAAPVSSDREAALARENAALGARLAAAEAALGVQRAGRGRVRTLAGRGRARALAGRVSAAVRGRRSA